MNIRELVKIANKLDSLGLTGEADILDGIIRKSGSYPGLGDFRPPANIESLMSKWLDYFSIRNVIGFSDVDADNSISEIETLCQYISNMADKDSITRAGLYSWYEKNIEGILPSGKSGIDFHRLISNDLYELANDIEDAVKNYVQQAWDPRLGKVVTLSERYAPVVKKIRATAVKWNDSYGREGERVERKPRPGSAAERGGLYGPVGGPQAMEAGKTYAPYKEPESNLTGWDKYTAKQEFGAAVQKAWNDFVSGKGAGKYNRSFGSFVSWYKENKDSTWGGKHKSTQQVADILLSMK